MKKILSILFIVLTLAGCAGVPVAIISPSHSLTGWGSSNQDLTSFSFLASDDYMSCSGSYDLAHSFAANFNFRIYCDDGRTGKVMAVRVAEPMDPAGQDFPVSGKVVFSDGSVGMFNLGSYAKKMNENSITYKYFLEDQQVKKFK